MSNHPSAASLDIIKNLIAFDTTSCLSNLPLQDYVQTYLQRFGIPVTTIANAEGSKANLLAYIGPQDTPAILISGHTDVVPADPSQWFVTAPFTPHIVNGKLYGRGSADMKAFIAIALAKLAPLHASLKGNSFIVALSFDEEVGCQGAPLMIPQIQEHAERIRGCIIGEPTSMQVGYAHKGHMAARATVHGKGGHSGYPERGVNAISMAARLIGFLDHVGEEKRSAGQIDSRFEPPYSTVQTGIISGGTALNKIPEACTFDFETRPLPGHDPLQLLDQVQHYFDNEVAPRVDPDRSCSHLVLENTGQYPQFNETRTRFIDWVRHLASETEPAVTLGFGSEAGLFAEIDIPTVVCGPGSIFQAHLPDEYISLEQMALAERFFDKLIEATSVELPDFKK